MLNQEVYERMRKESHQYALDHFKENWSLPNLSIRERWRQDEIMDMANELNVAFNMLHWNFQQRVIEPSRLYAKLKEDKYWEMESELIGENISPEQLYISWKLAKDGNKEESLSVLFLY
jgi:hypothetical protein